MNCLLRSWIPNPTPLTKQLSRKNLPLIIYKSKLHCPADNLPQPSLLLQQILAAARLIDPNNSFPNPNREEGKESVTTTRHPMANYSYDEPVPAAPA